MSAHAAPDLERIALFSSLFKQELRVPRLGPCKLWTRPLDEFGYGHFWMWGQNYGVHQLALLFSGGRIEPEQVVRHLCHVRHCGEPSHLAVGSRQDDVDDKMKDGRHQVARGELQGFARLTDQEVIQVKQLLWEEVSTQRAIARAFHIGEGQISGIKHGKIWRHIPWPNGRRGGLAEAKGTLTGRH